MTPEDEEFNRIEMESRIKQEYVRDINKRMELYPKHTMHELVEELALARVLIRELGDRLAKLEKTEQNSVVCCQQYDTCLQPCTPRGEHLARRTWVGLTDEEIWAEGADNVIDLAFARDIEAKLKEKNT